LGGFLGSTHQPYPAGSLRGLALERFGYAGSFYEITMGANYKYSANTMIRPMLASTGSAARRRAPNNNGAANLKPFDNGTGNSQTVARLRRGHDLLTADRFAVPIRFLTKWGVAAKRHLTFALVACALVSVI